jgi:hypothetical protein
VAEQLARAEQVEHAAVVDDLDRARAHHPQVLDGIGALQEDDRTRGMELDLRRRLHPPEVRGVDRVERRPGAQEVRDLVQVRWPGDISVLTTKRVSEHTRARDGHGLGGR